MPNRLPEREPMPQRIYPDYHGINATAFTWNQELLDIFAEEARLRTTTRIIASGVRPDENSLAPTSNVLAWGQTLSENRTTPFWTTRYDHRNRRAVVLIHDQILSQKAQATSKDNQSTLETFRGLFTTAVGQALWNVTSYEKTGLFGESLPAALKNAADVATLPLALTSLVTAAGLIFALHEKINIPALGNSLDHTAGKVAIEILGTALSAFGITTLHNQARDGRIPGEFLTGLKNLCANHPLQHLYRHTRGVLYLNSIYRDLVLPVS